MNSLRTQGFGCECVRVLPQKWDPQVTEMWIFRRYERFPKWLDGAHSPRRVREPRLPGVLSPTGWNSPPFSVQPPRSV